jgi:hypothetical protein
MKVETVMSSLMQILLDFDHIKLSKLVPHLTLPGKRPTQMYQINLTQDNIHEVGSK